MKKLIANFKRFYPFLLNAIIPFVVFFFSVYSTSFVDGYETITYNYNFYKLLDFNLDKFYAIYIFLIIFSSAVNFILFIVYMCDSYKLYLYKNMLNKILLTFSYVILFSSISILIYSIYVSTLSKTGAFVYNNSFNLGSVVLLLYSIIQTILVMVKFKRKHF